MINLANIGKYESVDELPTIAVAGFFVTILYIIAVRIGNVGGLPLNLYFDMFGLEGILSNVALIVVIFQIARYFYTTLYEKNERSWSPFVFVCIVVGAQIVYDLILYYGVINNLKKGQSDIFDILRAYANEGGWHCILTDSIFMILTALAAMVLNDTSDISKIVLLMLVVFLIPYVLSIPYKKPAPPPPPPKEETMRDARGF